MKRFDVGYATDDTNARVGWDDFVLALLICSMSYEDFINLINNRTPDGKQGKCRLLWWKDDQYYFLNWLKRQDRLLCKRIKAEKHFNFVIKMKQFSKYLEEGTQMPLYWEGENTSNKRSGAHWSQTVFTTAISNLGYTRSEALNTPLVQLFNDFFKWGESQGAVELMSEQEEMLVRAQEKAKAKA